MGHRVALNSLYAKRSRLRRRFAEVGHILRGSVVVLRRPCTYPGCRKCRDGTRHPATYHSVSRESRTHLTYLSKAVASTAREWNENWREVLGIAEELTEVNLRILQAKAKSKRERGRK